MSIPFSSSQRSSVGVEWELALVDAHTQHLVNEADRVLSRIRRNADDSFPHVTTELMQNTVELVSAPHQSVSEVLVELKDLVREVESATSGMNIELMCAGSHPLSVWSDQIITDNERYTRFIERTEWWGRNMMIWGVHVHVGVESRDKVIPIMHALLAYYPHLQALSASSPFWAGEVTGYASNRALMFQQLPTAGLPFDVDSWSDFEHYIDDAIATGIISEVNEARWDIRPSPRWGSVELRYCDGLSTLKEIGAVTALSQCLTEYFSRQLDSGQETVRLQPWFVRENKWRAARYGLEANIIVNQQGQQRSVREELHHTVAMLHPVAIDLGCTEELSWVLDILGSGASYQRQLNVLNQSGGNLNRVVQSLTEELHAGMELT